VSTKAQRLELAALLTVLVAATAIARSAPSDGRGSRATPGPGALRAVGFYDPTLRRVVLVGGAGQPRSLGRDGVWSWTGTRWEPMTDSGPTARSNASAAYDARRRVAVVAGGTGRSANDSTFEVIGDTWEGSPTGWRRIAGADIEPRDHQSMVYDEGRDAVLMFGGILGDRSAPWPTDTWELRQEGWVRIATEGPAGRGRTALAYDNARRQIVLFGGVGAPPAPGQPQPFFNDTWVWERDGWRMVAEDGPPARYAHGMAFDERAGVVLLYSGSAAHRDAPLTDMWQWDGTRWTEIRPSGPTPGHRYQPVMVYDRARGKTVLYGGLEGSKDDTWEWDGRQWREIRP
jgi:hypothetical protein